MAAFRSMEAVCNLTERRLGPILEDSKLSDKQHRGKTHCAWVQIWASGQKLRISGYVLKSNVNKIKSRTAKFENKK